MACQMPTKIASLLIACDMFPSDPMLDVHAHQMAVSRSGQGAALVQGQACMSQLLLLLFLRRCCLLSALTNGQTDALQQRAHEASRQRCTSAERALQQAHDRCAELQDQVEEVLYFLLFKSRFKLRTIGIHSLA